MNAKGKLVVLTVVGLLSLGVAAAKHGADDPPGDDRGGQRVTRSHQHVGPLMAKNGADDAPGDDHGQHGAGHA